MTSNQMPNGGNATNSQTNNNTATNVGSGNVGGGDAVQSVNTFNAMQQDIQELRGSVEELQYKLQQLEQQQKDRYLDVDRRLQALSGGAAVGSPASTTDATAPSSDNTSANSATSASSENEKTEYDTAFNLMTKDKNFDKATKAFGDFVEHYPKGTYTPNAWYWLGKLYSFDTKNLAKSRDAFQKVVQDFPTNTKAADALYELGVTYDKLGSKDQAKKSLKSVSSQYPGTGAALKAEQYIKEKSL
jgi:tol-pal system protein YbgF